VQVKQTVERCLAEGMNKAQMFREIREEGLQLGAAFAGESIIQSSTSFAQASLFNGSQHRSNLTEYLVCHLVYKELRDQNHGFFKEYSNKIDLKEQHQQLNRLIRTCLQGARNAEDGARVPEIVTPQIATDVPVNTDGWLDQQALTTWMSNGGHRLPDLPAVEQVPDHGQPVASAVALAVAWLEQKLDLPALEQLHNHGQPVSNVGFQGAAWPQQGLHLPVTQQLHYHEETAANGGFPGPQNEVNMHAGQPPRDHQQPVPDSGFQGLTWPQQAVHSPAEQRHYHEQVAVNGFPPQTLFPGLSSEAMINPCPISHGGQNLWQQAGTLEQWRPAENANPLPSYSLSEPREEHYESTTVSKDNGGQS
jgi:hypothetical protein